MAVRNYYLEAEIDGRNTKLTGGPSSKEGGFHQTIFMRDEGEIVEALNIYGESDGKTLKLTIYDGETGRKVYELTSER